MVFKIVISLMIAVGCAHGQLLKFKEDSFSFGDIDDLNTVNRDVEFQNIGDQALVIEKVKASCGCTAGSLEKKELAPMESSKVSVAFNPKGRSGKQHKSVTFFTNDIENKVKKISFTANVVPVWELDPRRLEFKLKADHSAYEVGEKLLFVKNLSDEPIHVESVSSPNSNLTIETPDSTEIKPNEKMKATVRINPEYKPEYSVPTSIMVNAKIKGETTNRSLRVVISVPPKAQL